MLRDRAVGGVGDAEAIERRQLARGERRRARHRRIGRLTVGDGGQPQPARRDEVVEQALDDETLVVDGRDDEHEAGRAGMPGRDRRRR